MASEWDANIASDSLKADGEESEGVGSQTTHVMDASLPPLSASVDKTGLSIAESDKRADILLACRNKDLTALSALATSQGGLLDDEVRRTAWPILLGSQQASPTESTRWQDLQRHRDEDQVQLDVNRSFVYYPSGESDKRIEERKLELSDVITQVLRRHPSLCYFQGYHDIVQVLLLVLGAHAAAPAVERLSLLRIRDFMLPTMTASITHLSLLPPILRAADPGLFQHLSQTAPFYFALPATLTLYAHDIQEYGDIARLFDYLLANEAVISVYLFATIIRSRKDELMQLEADEHDMLHSILSKLPKPLDLEHLIERTTELYRKVPPAQLRGWSWHQISSASVLKTARTPLQVTQQSLSDGERFLDRQAHEIKKQDIRQRQLQHVRRLALRYRRPALMTGTALFVAVLALYIRDADNLSSVREWVVRAWTLTQRLVQ